MTNMITCHVCGAQNDPNNRFCDQCGARLNVAEPTVVEPAAISPSSVTALACSICGAQVLPGQVFCDNCGADLRIHPPIGATGVSDVTATPDAETVLVPPGSSGSPASPASPPPIAAADEVTVVVVPEPQPPSPYPPSSMSDETVIAPGPSVPFPVMPDEQTLPAPVQATESALPPSPATPAPPPEPATPAPPPPVSVSDVEQERQRLEGDVLRHRNSIAQLEQMLSSFPAGAAPDYLSSTLKAAHESLQRAEMELSALPTQPQPDPAEVARLEQEITRHSESIKQMEQMMQGYSAGSVPDYLAAALENAHRALSQAEADLAALRGGTGVPPLPFPSPAPAPEAAAPVSPSVPAAAMDETLVAPSTPASPGIPDAPPAPVPLPEPEPTPAMGTTSPAPAPSPALIPRLIVSDGSHEIALPADKAEVTVGREDPVSNIFPDVDLTPYGGEAGGVSRQHARLRKENGQWTVTDLNSTNFTRVNNKRIDPNVPVPIEDGTQIHFGRVSVTFKV